MDVVSVDEVDFTIRYVNSVDTGHQCFYEIEDVLRVYNAQVEATWLGSDGIDSKCEMLRGLASDVLTYSVLDHTI